MKKAMKIKVINRSAYALPQYETAGAAGMDVRADIRESIVLGPLERTLVPTGLYVEIPDGCREIQVRPRSGLAARHGISLANSPGTIDPDYRGEIKAILVNLSDEPFEIKPGERIAQLVVARFRARRMGKRRDALAKRPEARAAWDRPDEGDPAPDYEEIARTRIKRTEIIPIFGPTCSKSARIVRQIRQKNDGREGSAWKYSMNSITQGQYNSTKQ